MVIPARQVMAVHLRGDGLTFRQIGQRMGLSYAAQLYMGGKHKLERNMRIAVAEAEDLGRPFSRL